MPAIPSFNALSGIIERWKRKSNKNGRIKQTTHGKNHKLEKNERFKQVTDEEPLTITNKINGVIIVLKPGYMKKNEENT